MSSMSERKADAFDKLRGLAGYVEDGSETTVKIFQDDATRTWFVKAGTIEGYDTSLIGAIESAASTLAAREVRP